MKKFILLICIFLMSVSPTAKRSVLTIFIPLYSCPSDDSGKIWRGVLNAGKKGYRIIVVWGIICKNDNYKSKLLKFKEAGIKNIVYIATNSSTTILKKIKRKIDFYDKYPIDGYFFDEISFSSKKFNYNESLVKLAKNKNRKRLVVFNSPYASKNFVSKTSADLIVVFENDFKNWECFKDNYSDNLKDKLIVIIHSTDEKNFKTAFRLVLKRNYSYFYITDRGYNLLPSYFK